MVTGQATARNPGAAARSTGPKAHLHEKAVAGEDRYRMIAEAAYYRAENRGFSPGSELDDWLAAEIEVDELLAESHPR
mgnify:CR=1 FL=1